MRDARRDQTRQELVRLQKALKDWLDDCEEKDVDREGKRRYQYDSQLKAIYNSVNTAAEVIKGDLDNFDLEPLSLGGAYAKCAQYDQLVIWLWRVFRFFRDKFDQRDDAELGQTLRAADEVLWSCYKPFFQRPRTAGLLGPPPLPYIESEYSPLAIRKEQKPGSLDKQIKFEPLQKLLDEMPVDLMRLPTSTVSAAWSLALVGHEAGHFVMPAVGQGYAKQFGDALSQAVAAAGGDGDDEANWYAWAPEVFADWYSVLMVGPWAPWVMAQFELKDAKAMAEPRKSYPPPVVRLKLLSELADHYAPGEAARSAARLGLDAEFAAAAASVKDFGFVTKLREAITSAQLPNNLGRLQDLVNFRADDFDVKEDAQKTGEVDKWAGALLKGWKKNDDRQLRTARLIAAGAAQAWAETMPVADRKSRRDAAELLNQNAPARIRANGEAGKRDAAPASAQEQRRKKAESVGAELGKLLLGADPQQLEDE